MAKLSYIHTMKYSSANKKEQNIDTCNTLNESWGNYVEKQMLVLKGCMLWFHLYNVVFLCFVSLFDNIFEATKGKTD